MRAAEQSRINIEKVAEGTRVGRDVSGTDTALYRAERLVGRLHNHLRAAATPLRDGEATHALDTPPSLTTCDKACKDARSIRSGLTSVSPSSKEH